MTDIAYHPARLRALREQFRALRAAEFPWTADTVYLNNAAVGPIPERTRRALDEFTAKRTAPHLLPDRELLAGLQAARAAVARLLNADPAEIALATNTSHGLNAAARALPLASGDVVLVSDREFPANVYPWLLLRKRGVEVELAPLYARGLARRGLPGRAPPRPPGAGPRHFVRAVRERLPRGPRPAGRRLSRQRHLPGRGRHPGDRELGARRAGDARGRARVRRAEVAALAVGVGLRVRAPRADHRARAGGHGMDGVRGHRRLLAPHRVQPHLPRRRPPLRDGHPPLPGLLRHDRLGDPARRARRRRHRAVHARPARAGPPLGGRARRARRVAPRRRPPLGHSLPRAPASGRSLPRPEARPRGVLPARGRHPPRPALLQHRGRDGTGAGRARSAAALGEPPLRPRRAPRAAARTASCPAAAAGGRRRASRRARSASRRR